MTIVVFGRMMYKLVCIIMISILLAGCNSDNEKTVNADNVITGKGYSIEKGTNGVYLYTDRPEKIKDIPEFKIINES